VIVWRGFDYVARALLPAKSHHETTVSLVTALLECAFFVK